MLLMIELPKFKLFESIEKLNLIDWKTCKRAYQNQTPEAATGAFPQNFAKLTGKKIVSESLF